MKGVKRSVFLFSRFWGDIFQRSSITFETISTRSLLRSNWTLKNFRWIMNEWMKIFHRFFLREIFFYFLLQILVPDPLLFFFFIWTSFCSLLFLNNPVTKKNDSNQIQSIETNSIKQFFLGLSFSFSLSVATLNIQFGMFRRFKNWLFFDDEKKIVLFNNKKIA